MRAIRKGREPRSLTEYRAEPKGTSYDSFPGKQQLREALANEQGHICCYCMTRIIPDEKRMKIEHWASQERHPELALVYSNMLGACTGNMGAAPSAQHCDTYKGSSEGPGDIKLNPTDVTSGWERSIHYSKADGRIWSTNAAHDHDLDRGGLNLNCERLKEARLAAWRGVQEAMAKKNPNAWTPAVIERYLAGYVSPDDKGCYRPFCEAIAYFLRKRLAR